jgi:hypothetical protein
MLKFQKNLRQSHFAWGLITPGKDFDWLTALKSRGVLGRMLLRVLPLAVGSYTPMWATSILTMTRRFWTLYRAQGPKGLVKYTKVCSIILQQAAGGQRIEDLSSIGPRVARTASGLPRIINKAHRALIRKGDPNVIRMYLTLFGIYRVVEFTGKVDLSTITGLCLYRQEFFLEHVKFIPIFWGILAQICKMNPQGSTLEERLGYFDETSKSPTLRIDRILPITQSGPMSSGAALLPFMDPVYLDLSSDKIKARMEQLKANPDGVGFLLGLWRGLRPSEIALKERMTKAWKGRRASSVGTLWFTVAIWMNSGLLPTLIEWTKRFDNKPVKTLFKTAYTNPFGKLTPWATLNPGNTTNLGKLAFLEEPAGKVRVVAMVDVITQSILYPLHKWIFSLLEKIPQDGTFDQRRPIELLNSTGEKTYFSYDLSSATDRLPLALQQALLEAILGEKTAANWATLLVGRTYSFHPRTAEKWNLKTSEVHYAAGQPMGAYSSWAMLALTHHLIIQMAAWRVSGVEGWFTKYAVLGDDVVIADAAVAKAYFHIMVVELGVKIQETKSLISTNGSFEFAKKTFIRGVEVSPVSLKGFQAALRNLPVMEGLLSALPGVHSYRLKDVARALGFGFRVLGSLQSALKTRSRIQGLIVFLTRPSGILGESWLRWLSQETWLIQGGLPTQDSINSIYSRMGEWAAERLVKMIASRRDAFSRDSGKGGWIPTLQFPTRALFDVYVELVLRPISRDLDDRLNETETLLLQWRERESVTLDEFNIFMSELEGIMESIDLIPSSPRVARRSDEKPPVGSSVLKLWRLLRPLVNKG